MSADGEEAASHRDTLLSCQPSAVAIHGPWSTNYTLSILPGSRMPIGAAVNRVNRAYEAGGIDAFWDELEQLDDDVLQITVAGAFFPVLIRKLLEDQMAELGLTFDDLREILRKAENLASNKVS